MRVQREQLGGYTVTLEAGEGLGPTQGPIIVGVPDDPMNNDTAALLKMIEAGTVTVEPYVAPPPSDLPMWDQIERCRDAFGALALANSSQSQDLVTALLAALDNSANPAPLCAGVGAAIRKAFPG